ncbi:hypothetical protein [Streptomyces sp. NPDC002520]
MNHLEAFRGGADTGAPDPGTLDPMAWYAVTNKASGKCIDARRGQHQRR